MCITKQCKSHALTWQCLQAMAEFEIQWSRFGECWAQSVVRACFMSMTLHVTRTPIHSGAKVMASCSSCGCAPHAKSSDWTGARIFAALWQHRHGRIHTTSSWRAEKHSKFHSGLWLWCFGRDLDHMAWISTSLTCKMFDVKSHQNWKTDSIVTYWDSLHNWMLMRISRQGT